MNTDMIRVGVIGCGLIAQTMHLPVLRELAECHIEAVCDISPGTASEVARRYGVAKVYYDHRDLLADPEIDAVALLTYDHGDVLVDVLRAGKHVLVEKPLAFTTEEAERIIDAARDSDVVSMVGYMKLYDPGVEFAAEWMRKAGEPRSVQVHDFGGRIQALHRHDILPVRVDDLPPVESDRTKKFSPRVEERIADALGDSHAGYAELFSKVLMLGCHDMAVLRFVVGGPVGVRHAQPVGKARALAVLELENGAPCVFEVGVGPHHGWWDEHLTVYADREEMRLEFGNPFYPYQPTEVRLKSGENGVPSTNSVKASHDFGFRREWLHFAECIRTGKTPRTPLADGLREIELALDIVRAMPPAPGRP
ncbi:Gfo/Idh/MocA family oxidoreductase [Nonomuraea sp. NPDC050643]|uniref:Gfo/Idh/MocA family protein n=1 Tax=Nonomuraea sp. NPDC050643 TaxID=3155660 RepID=UPI0033D17E2C